MAIFWVCVLILSIGVSLQKNSLKERISKALPRMILIQFRTHTTLSLTCAKDGELPILDNGKRYSWYSSSLSVPFSDFLWSDTQHNHVVMRYSSGPVCWYCVDPTTDNIVTVFRLPFGMCVPGDTHTTCPLVDGYHTILSCRDMIYPPVEFGECGWSYREFGEQISGVRQRVWGDDFLLLGDTMQFPERAGEYECWCRTSASALRLIMTFIVNTTTDSHAHVAPYQFCLHMGVPQITTATVTQDINHGILTEDPAIGPYLLFSGLAIVIVVFLGIVAWTSWKKHKNQHRVHRHAGDL